MNPRNAVDESFIDQPWGYIPGNRRLERAGENIFSLSAGRPRRSALIVEDDISSSHMVDLALRGAERFTRIDWAASVEEAMAFLKKNSQAFGSNFYDLIFIDVYLDGKKTGVDLWNSLQERGMEGVPVIMTSSMTEEVFSELLPDSFARPMFLRKPFSMGLCIETISQVMKVVQ